MWCISLPAMAHTTIARRAASECQPYLAIETDRVARSGDRYYGAHRRRRWCLSHSVAHHPAPTPNATISSPTACPPTCPRNRASVRFARRAEHPLACRENAPTARFWGWFPIWLLAVTAAGGGCWLERGRETNSPANGQLPPYLGPFATGIEAARRQGNTRTHPAGYEGNNAPGGSVPVEQSSAPRRKASPTSGNVTRRASSVLPSTHLIVGYLSIPT